MARGYLGRLMSAGVSRHTVSAPPLPPEVTAAEFASRVYRQRWASRSAHGKGSHIEFFLLALNAGHAREVGERRLEREYGPGVLGDAMLIENVEDVEWRHESVVACLTLEPFSEREIRRSLFRWQVPA